MAKGKIKVEFGYDIYDIPCLIVSCKRGKLNDREVYEALEKDYYGQIFVHIVPVPEDVPTDLYEDGDVWLLYEPYDIIQSLLQYTGGEYQ